MIAARPEFSRARPGQPGRVYAVCRRRKELFAALHNQITEGAILKPLLSFFFPILLGTFFQQLYNTVDAIIVGNFVGTAALGAVGGPTAVLINFLVNLFVGLSSGATVVIAQYYGSPTCGSTSAGPWPLSSTIWGPASSAPSAIPSVPSTFSSPHASPTSCWTCSLWWCWTWPSSVWGWPPYCPRW